MCKTVFYPAVLSSHIPLSVPMNAVYTHVSGDADIVTTRDCVRAESRRRGLTLCWRSNCFSFTSHVSTSLVGHLLPAAQWIEKSRTKSVFLWHRFQRDACLSFKFKITYVHMTKILREELLPWPWFSGYLQKSSVSLECRSQEPYRWHYRWCSTAVRKALNDI